MRRAWVLLSAAPLIAAGCGGGASVKHTKFTAKASRPVAIVQPTAGSSAHSPMTVNGSTTYFSTTVTLQLRAGSNVLAHKTVVSQPRMSGQHALFKTTLAFHVAKKTSGELIVSAKPKKSGSKETVSNIPLTLLPAGSSGSGSTGSSSSGY